MKIPTMCVVIAGDLETIETASKAVENGFPVLVVDNTGGVADVMARIFREK